MTRQLNRCILLAIALVAITSLASGCDGMDPTSATSQGIENNQPESEQLAVPNYNGDAACVPLTCVEAKSTCGATSNGCGGSLDCGTCSSGTCSAHHCCPIGHEWDGTECALKCRAGFSDCGGYCCKCSRSNCS